MEMASEVHFEGDVSGVAGGNGDGTWALFDRAQSGWFRGVQVNGMTHLDLSDITLWIDLLGQMEVINRTWTGVADGVRVTGLVNTVLRKFLGVVTGEDGSLKAVDEWVATVPEFFLLDENDSEG